ASLPALLSFVYLICSCGRVLLLFSRLALLPGFVFFLNDPPPTELYTLSLHDALPIFHRYVESALGEQLLRRGEDPPTIRSGSSRSEEHTSELQSRFDLVCRLLLEKKKE